MLELGSYFVAQHLLSHLLDGLSGEQGERLRNTDGGNSTALRVTKFIHRVHFGRRSKFQVLRWVKSNTSTGLRLEGFVGGSLCAIELEVSHGGGSGYGLCGCHCSTLT